MNNNDESSKRDLDLFFADRVLRLDQVVFHFFIGSRIIDWLKEKQTNIAHNIIIGSSSIHKVSKYFKNPSN